MENATGAIPTALMNDGAKNIPAGNIIVQNAVSGWGTMVYGKTLLMKITISNTIGHALIAVILLPG
jgi:hypothetical protein